MAERRKFLASLKEALVIKKSDSGNKTSSGETPSTSKDELFSPIGALDLLLQPGPSKDLKNDESDNIETGSQKNTILERDLEISSDDYDIDPTFSPDDKETTEDDSEFETEDARKIRKKKYAELIVQKKYSTNETSSEETPTSKLELLSPIGALDFLQPGPSNVTSNATNLMAFNNVESCSILNNECPSHEESSNSPKKRYKSDPSKWKRNVNRSLRLSGQSYRTVKGKVISAKPMQVAPCTNRHIKCREISEEGRQEIYDNFHSLKSIQCQREFFIRHIKIDNAKRKTVPGESRKSKTKTYAFTYKGQKLTVCRDFFFRTLGISEGLVRGAFKKLNNTGVLEEEKRGSNKTCSDAQINFIKEHIMSFPAVESHYCRKSSQFKYLDADLNITSMYNLYKIKCQAENLMKPCCMETYRKVFRMFKLTFHRPKKDTCKTCVKFKESTQNEKEEIRDAYNAHLHRKECARKRRDEDKVAAAEDSKTLSFNFDLQAVLSTPKGSAGPFFYVRKLAVYNLTVYNLGNAEVNCFTWDVTHGKRGSIEISSSIFKFILLHPEVTKVRMMSDSCGGQQKNFNFSCMCLYALQVHPQLETIDHVYFESGHSQMECDSVHSKIEAKAKNVPIYMPSDWDQLIRLARTKPKPYDVTKLEHDDFLNFNHYQDQFVQETSKKQKNPKKKNENSLDQNFNFNSCVWFQYRKSELNKIFVKTNYDQIDFQILIRKRKRGKISITRSLSEPFKPYDNRICISEVKKKDLLQLCNQGLVPRVHRAYYEQLPTSKSIRDSLPEPDVTEIDDEI